MIDCPAGNAGGSIVCCSTEDSDGGTVELRVDTIMRVCEVWAGIGIGRSVVMLQFYNSTIELGT